MKNMTKLARANQFNTSGVVHYRVDQRDNGGLVTLSIDFERAPEPEHSYIADYFEVHRTEADVILVFGKTDYPTDTSLRNKIEVYFPIHSFMHQLWKSTRKMHEALRNKFEKDGKEPRMQGDSHTPGTKVQTLAANNALIVNSGGQCVTDFFLIAAKDVWLKTQKNEPLNISAIVRVFFNEYLLLGLLNRCEQVADEVRGDLDIPVEEEQDEVVEPFEL